MDLQNTSPAATHLVHFKPLIAKKSLCNMLTLIYVVVVNFDIKFVFFNTANALIKLKFFEAMTYCTIATFLARHILV